MRQWFALCCVAWHVTRLWLCRLDRLQVYITFKTRSKRISAVTRHKDHERLRNTGNLDVQILQAVYEYQQGHLGSPELSLSRLVETLGAERVHVVRCLRVLREKDWLDYNLTEGAESGLVWLTRFGTRVAESLHRD